MTREPLISRLKGSRITQFRGEIAWVAAQKLCQFFSQLILLKILTGLLSQKQFGEYSLFMSSLNLLAIAMLLPVQKAYLRYFHIAPDPPALAAADRQVRRWYFSVSAMAVALAVVVVLIGRERLGFEPFALIAASFVIGGNQLRMLWVQTDNIRRERKRSAMQSIGFQTTQVLLVGCLLYVGFRSVAGAIAGVAITAWLFAIIGYRPIPSHQGSSVETKSSLTPMIISYGIPFAIYMGANWVQTFSDRFVIASFMDVQTAGQYVAAFQVTGVPFMLLWFFLEALLVPIMYQRCREPSNPKQVLSASKILLLGAGVYLAVGALCVIGYSFGGQWLLARLTTEAYVLPFGVLMVMVFCRATQCLSLLLDTSFAFRQAMRFSAGLRVGLAVAAPFATYIGVRYFGLLGAAWGSLTIALIHLTLICCVPNGVFFTILRSRKLIAQQS